MFIVTQKVKNDHMILAMAISDATDKMLNNYIIEFIPILLNMENQELRTMKLCPKPLRSNPFTTYRDPKTGRWLVVKPTDSTKIDQV